VTKDAAYERVVTDLERSYEKVIARQAERLIDSCRGSHLDEDEAREEARELLTSYLLNDEQWEPVAAADISDIAYEAVEKAARG